MDNNVKIEKISAGQDTTIQNGLCSHVPFKPVEDSIRIVLEYPRNVVIITKSEIDLAFKAEEDVSR